MNYEPLKTNSWRCPFCGGVTTYDAHSGQTQGLVVVLHLKHCRILAPLVASAALNRKLYFERINRERNHKGRR